MSSTTRRPIWDSIAWLQLNYKNNNGLPGFFLEGGYRYLMRTYAEEDYIYSVDQATQSNDVDFRKWAENIILNDYSPLYLIPTNDFWNKLAEQEIQEMKVRKLNESILAYYKSSALP